jgi:2,4-dienoyl-CoA reductase (NADPH2)
MIRSPLFEPARFAALSARNRIAMPALHLGRAAGGRPDPELLDLYAERARGGAGVITVGVCDTGFADRSSGPGLANALSLGDDGCVAPMAELAGRIREHGALAGAQISPLAGYNDPRWCPAPEELGAFVASFGAAAARAGAAGFDFVEVMLSGGGALSHFVSRAHNRCEIAGYSGSLENRLRLPLEVIAAVRAAAGPALVIAARMHCHEFLEGGYDADEAARIAAALERGGVQAIDITGGGHRTPLPQITHQVPPLAFAPFARRVADAAGVTTLYGGQIRIPADAERALAATGCDFVNLGRALLADPMWPAKAASGEAGEIVQCMTCGRCFDEVVSRRAVICSANPALGEAPRRMGGAPARRMKAIVVGSGPAGMRAALDLRALGHEVALFERASALGGRWVAAACVNSGDALGRALDSYTARIARSGISVETGVDVTPESARGFGADLVVLATGAVPRRPFASQRPEDGALLLAEEAIDRPGDVGRRVAIVGAGGVGLTTAIHLASEGAPDERALGFLAKHGSRAWLDEALARRSGREVTLIKRRGYAGKGLGRSVRWTLMREVEELGVQVVDRAEEIALSEGGVSFTDGRTGAQTLLEVDTVIVAAGYEPIADLRERFASAAPKVVVIGDAREVGGIGAAIADAHRAVLELA